MKHTRTGVSLTGSLTLLLVAAPALAQEPNPFGRFSFSQGLRLSDNPDLVANSPGSVVTSTTGLGFEFSTSTRVDQLRLTMNTSLEGRFGDGAGPSDDFEFVNDNVRLTYARDGKNAGFDVSARYNNFQLEDIEIGDDFDPDVLVLEGGTRELTSLSFGFDTGRNARTSFEFDFGYRAIDYTGISDPDLRDSETIDVDAAASFALRDNLRASVLAGIQREDEAGGTLRETSYVGVGLGGSTPSGFTFSGDVTYDLSETDNGVTINEDDGVGFQLSFTQDRPRGPYSLTLNSRVDDDGRSTRATLGRQMPLPDGSLSWSIGVADFDDSDPQFSASLAWTRELKDGSLTASLDRSARVDDSDAYNDTRIGLEYQKQLTEVSRLGASLDYFSQDELNGGNDDSRTNASITYSRSLTRDWSLNTGYEYSRAESAGDPDRTRNSVFVNVERDVTFGF